MLPVHPAAELFPMLSEGELRELGEDIKKKGLQQPLVIYTDANGEQALLDGRNRLAAMERVGIRFEISGINLGANVQTIWHLLFPHDDCHLVDRDFTYLDENIDPCAYVISANIHRRHLTVEQKRDLIAKPLSATPEKSDRQIAETVKASPTTVGTVRKELEKTGDVSKLDTRTDSKGRAQPAHKPPPKPSPDPLVKAAADRAVARSEKTRRQQQAAAADEQQQLDNVCAKADFSAHEKPLPPPKAADGARSALFQLVIATEHEPQLAARLTAAIRQMPDLISRAEIERVIAPLTDVAERMRTNTAEAADPLDIFGFPRREAALCAP
jgi:ParB-like chromosome segregation protein Spo0J